MGHTSRNLESALGDDGAPVSKYYSSLFDGVANQLQVESGFVAVNLASSEVCGSGRTLAVWKSEESMYAFVTRAAHLAAMTPASRILKPGYALTQWNIAGAEQVSFSEAVRQLAAKREH